MKQFQTSMNIIDRTPYFPGFVLCHVLPVCWFDDGEVHCRVYDPWLSWIYKHMDEYSHWRRPFMWTGDWKCPLYHIRTNIGKELNLANCHTIAKFKFCQYFFYNISIVTLVAFQWFCQINILPNLLFQQITKYYICQYLFLFSTHTVVVCKTINGEQYWHSYLNPYAKQIKVHLTLLSSPHVTKIGFSYKLVKKT